MTEESRKKVWVIIGIIAVIAIIAIAAIIQMRNKGNSSSSSEATSQQGSIQAATTSPEEVAPSVSAVSQATATPEVVKEAVSIATGTSKVTKDNIVVTDAGTPVKLNVMPASADAPKESAPIQASTVKSDANTVKISVSSAGFVPNTFTVKAGQLVNFVLTSTDEYTHVWLPDDQSLVATALGVAGHETRVKSWNAPKKGTYKFHCDIPGHAARGEVGTMIVQ